MNKCLEIDQCGTKKIIMGYNGNPYNKKMVGVDKSTNEIYHDFEIIVIDGVFYGVTEIMGTNSKILELQEVK
jgi:hypothetical protein